jgi:hypothetical protein
MLHREFEGNIEQDWLCDYHSRFLLGQRRGLPKWARLGVQNLIVARRHNCAK